MTIFQHIHIFYCLSSVRIGGPRKKRTRDGFLKRSHFLPKLSGDLSLGTMLALVQVSVINLMGIKEQMIYHAKQVSNSKDNASAVKNPSSL